MANRVSVVLVSLWSVKRYSKKRAFQHFTTLISSFKAPASAMPNEVDGESVQKKESGFLNGSWHHIRKRQYAVNIIRHGISGKFKAWFYGKEHQNFFWFKYISRCHRDTQISKSCWPYGHFKYHFINIPAKKMFHSNIRICSVVDSYSHAVKKYMKKISYKKIQINNK